MFLLTHEQPDLRMKHGTPSNNRQGGVHCSDVYVLLNDLRALVTHFLHITCQMLSVGWARVYKQWRVTEGTLSTAVKKRH